MLRDFTPNEWTPELEDQILQWYCVDGLGVLTIGESIGISHQSVNRRLRKLGVAVAVSGGDRGNPHRYYELMGLEVPREFMPRIVAKRPEYANHHIPIVDPPSRKLPPAMKSLFTGLIPTSHSMIRRRLTAYMLSRRTSSPRSSSCRGI